MTNEKIDLAWEITDALEAMRADAKEIRRAVEKATPEGLEEILAMLWKAEELLRGYADSLSE